MSTDPAQALATLPDLGLPCRPGVGRIDDPGPRAS